MESCLYMRTKWNINSPFKFCLEILSNSINIFFSDLQTMWTGGMSFRGMVTSRQFRYNSIGGMQLVCLTSAISFMEDVLISCIHQFRLIENSQKELVLLFLVSCICSFSINKALDPLLTARTRFAVSSELHLFLLNQQDAWSFAPDYFRRWSTLWIKHC